MLGYGEKYIYTQFWMKLVYCGGEKCVLWVICDEEYCGNIIFLSKVWVVEIEQEKSVCRCVLTDNSGTGNVGTMTHTPLYSGEFEDSKNVQKCGGQKKKKIAAPEFRVWSPTTLLGQALTSLTTVDRTGNGAFWQIWPQPIFCRKDLVFGRQIQESSAIVKRAILGTKADGTKLWRTTPHKVGVRR